MKITVERLQEILRNHKRWAEGAEGGERANLTGANLRGADLMGADLMGADIMGAYLRGAYLTGADGEKIPITKAPMQIVNLRWMITIWDAHMQIGCEFHSHAEWAEFDDARIKQMDGNALDFWREWKEILMAMCKKHGGEMICM